MDKNNQQLPRGGNGELAFEVGGNGAGKPRGRVARFEVASALSAVPAEAAAVVQGDAVPATAITEGPLLDQVVELTTFAPALSEIKHPFNRLALALDPNGANGLPLLLTGDEGAYTRLNELQNLTTALAQLQSILQPPIKAVIFGGSAQAMLQIATGDWNHNHSIGQEFSHDFVAALGHRHYLDPAIIHNLRLVRSNTELLQLINHRRLGWLLDEICRMACLKIRRQLRYSVNLETIAFGDSGGVLGRALLEPGTFIL